MAYMQIGKQEKFAVGDWRFFAGYCPHCGRKHFLTRNESEKFIKEVSIFVEAKKINFADSILARIPKIKIVIEKGESAPEIEPIPIDIVRHREGGESRVCLFNFDNRYSEFGGLQWLRENSNLKLRQIAEHYGFSANYAKRVRNELTKTGVGNKIQNTNICEEKSKEIKKCILNGKKRGERYLTPSLAIGTA